ncbi:MAG: Bax inhibitor-1 family protein [Merdibacter sp.]
MFEQSYQNQFNADEGLRRHVQRTFGWMAVGLLITALSAAFFYFTGISMQIVLTSSAFMWLGILLQLGVVVAFMSGLHRRNLGSPHDVLSYSILTGFTFSLLDGCMTHSLSCLHSPSRPQVWFAGRL